MAPELRPLTDAQLRRVYQEHMRLDFPPSERRPRAAIGPDFFTFLGRGK